MQNRAGGGWEEHPEHRKREVEPLDPPGSATFLPKLLTSGRRIELGWEGLEVELLNALLRGEVELEGMERSTQGGQQGQSCVILVCGQGIPSLGQRQHNRSCARLRQRFY